MTPNAIQQPKARPVIFSLLTLLSGIIIGAGATLIFVGPPKEPVYPPFPEELSQRMALGMTHELGLTNEQQEAIRQVIETHMGFVEQIRQDARPLIQEELNAMNKEMLALMDEGQKQQWKENIERMNNWWREAPDRRGQRGMRGRGGGGDRMGRGGPGGDPNSPFMQRRRGGGFPGVDPNSPFMQRRRGGGFPPGGDPNSPFMPRRRGGDMMGPDMIPSYRGQQPGHQWPRPPIETEQSPQSM